MTFFNSSRRRDLHLRLLEIMHGLKKWEIKLRKKQWRFRKNCLSQIYSLNLIQVIFNVRRGKIKQFKAFKKSIKEFSLSILIGIPNRHKQNILSLADIVKDPKNHCWNQPNARSLKKWKRSAKLKVKRVCKNIDLRTF